MAKKMEKEIERLWNEGYGDALLYWGDRCVRNREIGYAIGMIIFGSSVLLKEFFRKKRI